MAAERLPIRFADDGRRAMPQKLRFTKSRLAEVKVPPGKDRVYVSDIDCPGLVYMKAAGGSERFYFYKKVNGQPRRYPIADGHVSVGEARALVRHELTEYA